MQADITRMMQNPLDQTNDSTTVATVSTSDTTAPNAENSEEVATSNSRAERVVTSRTRIFLLLGSFLTAAIPSCSISYVLLGMGVRDGSQSFTVIYIITGVASVASSITYAHFASSLGMRRIATIGSILMALSFTIMLFPWLSALYVAFFLETLASTLFVHPIIVSRQLLFNGKELARFSGWARFAYALGAAGGSWVGWVLSTSWQILPLLSLLLTACICFVLPSLPSSRT